LSLNAGISSIYLSRRALLLAAALGAVLGISRLDMPDSMSGSLVLAGITPYPPHSVMAVYYLNSWTALHQLGAIPLLLGAGQEITVLLQNALFGACTLGALAMISHALLRREWLALPVALLVYQWGTPVRYADYQIVFGGNHYGLLASVWFYFALGLLGSGRSFAAGAAALFAPALHPIVGAWTAGIGCAAAAVLVRADPAMARRFVRGAAAGATLTAASFIWYWLRRAPAPDGYDADLYRAYLALWDLHRNFGYNADALVLCAVSACFLAALLGARRDLPDAGGKAMLCALLLNAVASAAMYETAHRWGTQLPQLFTQIMPTRFAGLQLTVLVPIVLAAFLLRRWSVLVLAALAGVAIRTEPVIGVLVSAVVCWLLYAGWPSLSEFPQRARQFSGALLAIPVCTVFAWQLLQSQAGPKWHLRAASSDKPAFWLAIERNIDDIGRDEPPGPPAPQFFPGPEGRDPAAVKALHRQGVVAAPGVMHEGLVYQLHLPILLEVGSFDFLPYIPGLTTQVAGIIEEVYGVDFRAPPAKYRNSGSIGEYEGREHWQKLTEQDWVRLAPKYCIGGVAAPADWVVNLPVARDFGAAKYYRVPVELPEGCR